MVDFVLTKDFLSLQFEDRHKSIGFDDVADVALAAQQHSVEIT